MLDQSLTLSGKIRSGGFETHKLAEGTTDMNIKFPTDEEIVIFK